MIKETRRLFYGRQSDRLMVIACLVFVIALSWTYLLTGAGMSMEKISMSKFMHQTQWDVGYALTMFIMWWVMMVAMMLPSALPMILLFTSLHQKMGARSPMAVTTFVTAYLLIWGGFSAIATSCQWLLVQHDLIAAMKPLNSTLLGGGLLISAGIWQLSPWKKTCLNHCRAPIQFLSENWQAGTMGALQMGLKHGLYCLGCCWVLMALLFYGGIMNLLWIIGLAIFILIEKVMPVNINFSRYSGMILIAWGILLFF
jgi:predicted metal-binding membrane protein